MNTLSSSSRPQLGALRLLHKCSSGGALVYKDTSISWGEGLLPWTDILRAGSKQCLCLRLVVPVIRSGLVVQQPV